MKKKCLAFLLALVMCFGLLPATAFAADEPPVSFVNSYTSIQTWLNPEAEAYFKTLVTSGSRSKYQRTACANGWLVEHTFYDGTYDINDAAKAWYKTHDFYPTTGYAANTFKNETLISGLYCCPTPYGNMTAIYFGQNTWRGSSIERLTLDRLCTKDLIACTYSDKTTGASYTWMKADAQQASFGHPCVIFEDYAFADCKNLKSVVFTMECEDYYIAPTAFSNCPNLTITAPAGGKIEAFCKAHGIKFQSNGTVPNTCVDPFTDVKLTAWYADAVKWAVDKGVTTGKTATTFAPSETCTHAQILTFLWRAAGEPESDAQPPIDLKGNEFYYKAVKWAAEKGMIGADFNPNAPCNRAYAVLYIWQAMDKPAATSTSPFTDVPAHWSSAPAVAWAVEKGVTTGTSATAFSPAKICDRGTIVTFLYRAYK